MADRRRFGKGFWQLWTATTVSGLGDGVRLIALSVFAATLTRDPFQVSLVTVAGQLPWVLVGPFSGTLIDLVDRWRMLWVCDAARSAVLGCFFLAILTDRVGIAVLVVTAFLLSSIETMADNLSQAVVPDVAGARSLDSANSKLLTGRLITMEFLGAPIGTALFVVAQLLPFGLAAFCFAVSTVLIFAARPEAATAPGVPLTLRALGTQTAEGISWLWRHRLLRTVCLVVGALNSAVLAVIGIAVLYALHILHVSTTAYGLLLLVIAGGGLLGLLAAEYLITALGRGRILHLALAICPFAFTVSGLATDALVAAVAFAFVGASVALVNVITTTLRQVLIPPDRFGRVNGAYRLVVNGLSPLGGLGGGLLAGRFGLRAPFFAAAVLLAFCAVAALFLLPGRTINALPETPQEPGSGGPDTGLSPAETTSS
ncbi:MFS transporter [Streptomyces doebereineriae]|uniref:MFS transporter n=1 Tax=Streptomyces doebereineriae TaxID=3075528 RepID=A0ABU2VB01_9ACTN|nr:MFS transporter [Streptomyces sp. DSM 41640]MDT0482736.1 MFS transporter [Streptomyces sp. DSM 41640]